MKIGIDIDDVLCKTTECVIKVFNKLYDTNIKLSDINCWDFENCKAIPDGLKDAIWDVFKDEYVWEQIEIYNDCKNVIQELYEKGHDIYFITATYTENLKYKARLLNEHFNFIGDLEKSLIKVVNKQLVNIDVLIDDNMNNFINGNYYGIVVNQPWNINIDEADKKYCNGDCFRVNNWSEIPTYIKFISYCINEEINGEL